MNYKIRTIIVEDELPIREEILELALQKEELQIVGVGKNGVELEELLDSKKPDLALLDIELPIKNTMTVLSEKSTLPHIIFITAYDVYAPKAFEMAAIDYIVKPLKKERFDQAIARASERIKTNLANNNPATRTSELLWLRENDKIVPIPVSDILYIEARDKTTIVYTGIGKNFYIPRPFSSLMQQLDPARFLQIHRKYAVKISEILNMEALFHGQYEITLKSIPKKLPVSRRYARTILNK